MNPMSKVASFSDSASSRGTSLALACAVVFALASCASIDTAAPPVAALAVHGKDTATLENGRRIYLGSCTHCHVAQSVRDYAAARWPGIVTDMGERAHLSPAEQRAVLAYVLAAQAH
jgi:mono/diheme cytochrome c family protein